MKNFLNIQCSFERNSAETLHTSSSENHRLSCSKFHYFMFSANYKLLKFCSSFQNHTLRPYLRVYSQKRVSSSQLLQYSSPHKVSSIFRKGKNWVHFSCHKLFISGSEVGKFFCKRRFSTL